MQQDDVIPTIVLAAHALARIAAQDAGNEAPAAQWRVLTLLEQRGGHRIGALARAARTTQPGMTRLIGTLDGAGLVRRSSTIADSRGTLVEITPAGSTALADWRREFRATLAPRFRDLDDAEWATLARAAEILSAHAADDANGVDA